MICQYCKTDFMEKDIQVSHDVPKYIGGKDIDGRHNLCKKCHDIYERLVFWKMVESLDDSIKEFMRGKARNFAQNHFKVVSK